MTKNKNKENAYETMEYRGSCSLFGQITPMGEGKSGSTWYPKVQIGSAMAL
jgi:hypothetical protein